MRSFLPSGRWAGLCLGVFTATLTLAHSAQAQPARPAAPAAGVQRIEIYQGTARYIDYVPYGPLSANDRLAAHALQRAENELIYVDNLQRLKHQYVYSEREMEPRRHYAQEELYGLSITVGSYAANPTFFWGGGGGYSYPYAWNGNRYGGFGYGGGLGMGYGGLGGMAGGSGWMANRSLAHGMGDEGVMKNTLTQQVIAHEASSEYAASVSKGFHDALTTAGKSDVLRSSLGLGQGAIPPNPGRTVGYPLGVTLFTLRCHPPISGFVAREDAYWVVVRTAWGEVIVPRSEVLSYEPVPAAAEKPMKPVQE